MFTRDDLRQLIAAAGDPAVSIFLPTHVAGREIAQDPIRLKNLLAEAEERLTAAGRRRPAVAELLGPAQALVEDGGFWRHQSSGLALFLAPGRFQLHRVPLALEEGVAIGSRFVVRPLLPLLSDDGRFFLLTLSRSRVSLFEASRSRLDEKQADELPSSLGDVLGEVDFTASVHFHPTGPAKTTTGPPSAKFHALGDSAEEVREMATMRFLQRVDSAVVDHLTAEEAPLLVAAEERLFGHYRQQSKYRWLVPEGIVGNPDALSEAELHERALAVMRPHLEQARIDAAERFRTLAGSGLTATDVAEIVPAATSGRVETLFVAEGEERWGRFDPAAMRVDLHDQPREGDDEMLNLAAVQALVTGAAVYVAPHADLPSRTPAAAILRY